jgi:hypothetical protein
MPASARGAVSSFDSDAQGWQITQDGQTYTAAPWSNDATGQPPHGGHIAFTDAGDDVGGTPDIGYFRGGTGWSGDLSAHYGGTLSFELHYGTTPPSECLGGVVPCPAVLVRIYSPNGIVEKSWGQALVQGWSTHSVPISGNNPNGFQYQDGAGTPSPGHLASILSDVSSIEILAEVNWGDGGPTTTLRLDNASMTGGGAAPDPEPVIRSLTLDFSGAEGGFTGDLFAEGYQACTEGQKVTVRRRKRGRDPKVGTNQTDSLGHYLVSAAKKPGKYYATVKQTDPPFFTCMPATSELLRLN